MGPKPEDTLTLTWFASGRYISIVSFGVDVPLPIGVALLRGLSPGEPCGRLELPPELIALYAVRSEVVQRRRQRMQQKVVSERPICAGPSSYFCCNASRETRPRAIVSFTHLRLVSVHLSAIEYLAERDIRD